ncbi:MAG: ADP-ribosylglycohydrolase family protein, partial [Methanothrix sp.]
RVLLHSDRDPSDALELLGTSPSVHDAVPSAFYCFVRLEPEEALVEAVNAGGDTDSVASMAGALAGARYGTSWIPERWLSQLENRDMIEELGRDLGRLSLRLSGRV